MLLAGKKAFHQKFLKEFETYKNVRGLKQEYCIIWEKKGKFTNFYFFYRIQKMSDTIAFEKDHQNRSSIF